MLAVYENYDAFRRLVPRKPKRPTDTHSHIHALLGVRAYPTYYTDILDCESVHDVIAPVAVHVLAPTPPMRKRRLNVAHRQSTNDTGYANVEAHIFATCRRTNTKVVTP